MKRLVFAFTLLVSLIVSADDASYMYWMVGDTTDSSTGESFVYNTVKIGIADQDGNATGNYLSLFASASSTTPLGDGNSVSADYAQQAYSYGVGFYALLPATQTAQTYSFFIELLSGDTSVAYSEISWETAQTYAASTAMTPIETAYAPTAGGYTAAPEPTSGVLMLFGMVALSLRRKRHA